MKASAFLVSLHFLLMPLPAETEGALSPLVDAASPNGIVTSLPIRGKLRPVELMTDQVHLRPRTGAQSVMKFSGKRTIADIDRESAGIERRSGNRADLVAYLPDRPHTDQHKMLITKQVLVRLAEGVTPSVFFRSSGAAGARRPGFAPDALVLTYSSAVDAMAAAGRLQSLAGVLSVESVIAVKREPEFIPPDTYFSGGGPACQPLPQSDNVSTPTMTGLTTAAYQWWANNIPAGQGPRNSVPARLIFGDFPAVANEMADLRLPWAWEFTGPPGLRISGRNVDVAIIDDGIDKSHPDLGNAAMDLVASHHHNFFTGANSHTPLDPTIDTHGTSLAGIVGARLGTSATGTGIAGIAPECRLQGIVALKEFVDEVDWADSFAYGSTLTDTDQDGQLLDEERTGNPFSDVCLNASSASGSQDALDLYPEGWLWRRALLHGATRGRAFKGIVYVTSAGNGAEGRMNTNYVEQKNSIYQIPVAAVSDLGRRVAYSNAGASIVCAAPSWGAELPPLLNWPTRPAGFPAGRPVVKNPPIEPDDLPFLWQRRTQGIPTISTGSNFNFNFNGTSASAAQVAGIVALMLELRPDLSARDVKEILLRSCRVTNDVRYGTNNQPLPCEPDGPGSAPQQVYPWPPSGPHPPPSMGEGPTQWRMSRLGRPMHHAFGAGLIDAHKALKIAQRWTPLPNNPFLPRILAGTPPVSGLISNRITETGGIYFGIPTGLLIPTSGAAIEIFVPPPPESMRLEHIEVRVRFYHKRRGDMEIKFVTPAEAGWHAPNPNEPGGNSRGRAMVSDLYVPHRDDYRESRWDTNPELREPTDWTFTTVRHWGTRTNDGLWKVVIRDAITKGATTNPTLDDPVYCPRANPTDAASQRMEGIGITYHGTFGDLPSNEPPVIVPQTLRVFAGTSVVQKTLAVEPLGNGPDGTVAYPVLSWDFFNLSDIVPVHPAAPPKSPFEYFPPGITETPGAPPPVALYPLRTNWPAVPTWIPLTQVAPPNESSGALVSLPRWLEFSTQGHFIVLRDPENTDPLSNFIHVRLNRSGGILDIVPLHAGDYGINVVAENLTGISRPQRINITVMPMPVLYSEWLSTHFTPEQIADPAVTGLTADPDGDGFNNRIEYALAGDPLSSSTGRTPTAAFAEISGASYATLRFTRRTHAQDLTFAVQFSTELMTWDLPGVLVSSTGNGDGTTTEVWRSADPVRTRSRRFARVLVTTSP